jgi:hypothetical protein
MTFPSRARETEHSATTVLVAEMEALRAHARQLRNLYLPGPLRTAALHRIEAELIAKALAMRTLMAASPRECVQGVRVVGGTVQPRWDEWR